MKKRIISMMICLSLCLGLIPTVAPAASAADEWTVKGATTQAKKLGNSSFNLHGVDGGTDYQTTYRDVGYATIVTVDGGARQSNPAGTIAAGLTLTVDLSGEKDNYVKITYTVKNTGSAAHAVNVGTHADVMIDKNDRAPICAETAGGKTLVMTGAPKNSYAFKLIATTCDTLWYGRYSQRQENVFTDLPGRGPDNVFDGDSGVAWSWKDETVSPGETWTRSVLIGTGDAASMNVSVNVPIIPEPTPPPPPAPAITLNPTDYYLTEGDALPGDWSSFVASSVGTVSISGQPTSSGTVKDYTVTYTAASGGQTATAQLKVHILSKPFDLSRTTISGNGPFTPKATMNHTGGLNITETGFVYGALQNPTMSLKDGSAQTASVVSSNGGALSATVAKASLTEGIVYYARAYAKTSDGKYFYGEQSGGFGLGIPSYGAFSVSNNGSSSFTVSRSGGSDGVQKVYYRTVNGSAIGGTHFDHKYGVLTFAAGQTSQSIAVTEKAVTTAYNGKAATAYSNADRTYQLEIYKVEGGATIGTDKATRTMGKNNSYTVDRNIYTNWTTGYTDHSEHQITDKGYDNNYSFSFDPTNHGWSDYLSATASDYQFYFVMDCWEEEDGYQYMRVLNGNGNAQADKWEINPGKRDNNWRTDAYFPSSGNTGSRNDIKSQNWGCTGSMTWVKAAGREYFNLATGTPGQITVGFDAGGSGQDDWNWKNLEQHIRPEDRREPQLIGLAPMAGATYLPGESVTLALVFDEIVDSANSSLSGSSYITTNWGAFSYAGGANTNVLYFTGTVPANASGSTTVSVTGLNCAGQIKDMCSTAGTAASGSGSTTVNVSSLPKPTVSVGNISNSNGTLSAAISASNAGKLEYVWTTSASAPASGWRLTSSGTAVTTRQTSGTWYLHARATNNDGAVAAASKSYTIPTSGSGTVSLPELSVSTNNDSWAKTRAVTVTRKPANAAVTVTGPGANNVTVSGGSYSAAQNGQYTFTLTSGGDTVVQTAVVSRLDNDPPAIAIQDLTNTTHAAPVTLTFSVADGGSGVNSVSAKWNSTTATLIKNADGTYTTTSPNDGGNTKWKLTVTATDKVGNSRSASSQEYTVNNKAPALTVTEQSRTNQGVTYAYAVNANGNSGVTVVLPDGTATTELTGTFSIPKPGQYIVTVTDDAGHFVSQVLNVTAPGGVLDGVAPDVRYDANPWRTTVEDIDISLDVFEEKGLSSLTWTDPNGVAHALSPAPVTGAAGSYTAGFTVSKNGVYTVAATDNVGNVGRLEINVDWIHTHTVQTGNHWTHDNTSHWRQCTDKNCPDVDDSITDVTAHTKSWHTDDPDQHWLKCDICGWTGTREDHDWSQWVLQEDGETLKRVCRRDECRRTEVRTLTVTLPDGPFVYNGKLLKPKVTLKADGVPLEEGADKDYTVEYTDNRVVGTAKLTIIGQGRYDLSLERTFEIQKAPVPSLTPGGFNIANSLEKEYSYLLANLCPRLNPDSVTEDRRDWGERSYEIMDVDFTRDGYYTEGTAYIAKALENGQYLNRLYLPIKFNDVTGTGQVGTVTVKVSSANYEDFTNTVQIIANNKMAVTFESFTTPDKTYDGSPYRYEGTVTAVGTDAYRFTHDVEITYVGRGETGYSQRKTPPTNAGTFAMVVKVANTNEKYIGRNSYNFTIHKAEGVGSVDMEDFTYGEAPSVPEAASATNGVKNVGFAYKPKGAEDSAYTAVKPTTAGEYTVRASFPAVLNYNAVTATKDFTIHKAEGVGSVTMESFSHGEVPRNPEAVSATNGVEGVHFDYKPKNAPDSAYTAVKPTAAGEYTVRASFPAAANYSAVTATDDFTIRHAWLEEWAEDESFHWHECAGGDECEVTDNALKDSYGAHAAAGKWLTDEETHWKNCVCGREMYRTAHTSSDWIVSLEPTAAADGSRYKECTVCHRILETEAIPKLGNVSGIVEVKPGAPAVTADKKELEEIAGTPQSGKAVSLTLAVEQKEAATVKDDFQEAVDEKEALYLDLSLTKTIQDTEGNISQSPVTDTGETVLEVVIPFSFSLKKDVAVYRKHGSEPVRAMTALDARPSRAARMDGTFFSDVGNDRIYLYATKFSVYAITYTALSAPINYYTLIATAGKGGTISPSGRVSVAQGRNKDFTIAADEGYEIADVLVDGVSVGAVESYVFRQVSRRHTIEAVFQKARAKQEERPRWNPFEDVKSWQWFYDDVRYVYEQGLMNGTEDHLFSPGMTTSRAMIATILWRLAGSPESEAELAYPDCVANSWYAKAVAWASATGVVKGYDKGNFGPDDPVTREQLATMLYRYAGSPAKRGTLDRFADAGQAGGWATDALCWAVEEGILKGKDDGTLDPLGQAARAEAAAMLQRFCEREK